MTSSEIERENFSKETTNIVNKTFSSIKFDKNLRSGTQIQQPFYSKIHTVDTRYNLFDQFDSIIQNIKDIHVECGEIIEFAKNNLLLLENIIWLIKSQTSDIQKALITQLLQFCCCHTNSEIRFMTENLLKYLHDDITIWPLSMKFIFGALHSAGVNGEKLYDLLNIVQLTNFDTDLLLKNCLIPTTSKASINDILLTIKRVYRIILAVSYFTTEKGNRLSDDENLTLFVIGHYLMLDKRFIDINIIEYGRRLMANSLLYLTPAYWAEKRNLIISCMLGSTNHMCLIESLLKTTDRTIWLRSQIAFLQLKHLVKLESNDKRNEITILENIIENKLNLKLFDKEIDFIDAIRLISEIVDSYPFEQKMTFLCELHEKLVPYTAKTLEKMMEDQHHLLIFDYCKMWETMLNPVLTKDDYFLLVDKRDNTTTSVLDNNQNFTSS